MEETSAKKKQHSRGATRISCFFDRIRKKVRSLVGSMSRTDDLNDKKGSVLEFESTAVGAVPLIGGGRAHTGDNEPGLCCEVGEMGAVLHGRGLVEC